MVDPSLVQTVDSDVVYQCAYSLPAVAFTLGRHNWQTCLSQLFHTLASSLQVTTGWLRSRLLLYLFLSLFFYLIVVVVSLKHGVSMF